MVYVSLFISITKQVRPNGRLTGWKMSSLHALYLRDNDQRGDLLELQYLQYRSIAEYRNNVHRLCVWDDM